MHRKIFLGIIVSLVLLSSTPGLADGDIYVAGPYGTKITSLPCTITAPGAYYLGGNLSYSGTGGGITITSDDVTLDLMGFTLTYTGSGTSNSCIYMGGRTNVEIRNGTLSGWEIGIYVGGPGVAHRIINVRFEGNTRVMLLNGSGHLVQGCRATGGGSGSSGFWLNQGAVHGCLAKNFTYEGIMVGNVTIGSTISGNVVSDAGGFGIISHANTLIMENDVSNCATGIDSQGAASFVGNRVFTASSGQTGIAAPYASTHPALMDQNTVTGPGTHYSWGAGTVQWRNNAGYP